MAWTAPHPAQKKQGLSALSPGLEAVHKGLEVLSPFVQSHTHRDRSGNRNESPCRRAQLQQCPSQYLQLRFDRGAARAEAVVPSSRFAQVGQKVIITDQLGSLRIWAAGFQSQLPARSGNRELHWKGKFPAQTAGSRCPLGWTPARKCQPFRPVVTPCSSAIGDTFLTIGDLPFIGRSRTSHCQDTSDQFQTCPPSAPPASASAT